MVKHDDVTKENLNKHNWNKLYIPNHPNKILIIGGSGSGKTNALHNLIKEQDDDNYCIIDKIYLYVKDPYETKCQYLIKKSENNGLENLKDTKAFIEYSSNLLIIFDKMIADIISNKTFNQIVTELFIRGRKLNISTVFITQSYFQLPEDVRLNSTYLFIMKISNK